MIAFIFRRLLGMLFVLWCVITLTFFLVRLAPGSPFSKERKIPAFVEKQLLIKYKLDGTIWQQYSAYLGDIAHGDLRVSFKYRDRSVNELIRDHLPVSATLGLCAFVLATVVGIWLGSLAALRQNTAVDTASMLGALALISIPAFVTGPILVLIFALWLQWLPVGGWGSLSQVILPSIILSGPYIAYIARLMRSSLLEVLGQDFIRTARAKGLSENAILARHAIKVAILPVISFIGPLAANLLTGSIIVESIFSIPGIGGFFVNSILNRDVFLLSGVVIVYCTILMSLNLIVDVSYTVLDRRIKIYE